MKNLRICNIAKRKSQSTADFEQEVCYGHDENDPTGKLYTCSNNLAISCSDSDGCSWNTDLKELATPDNSPVNLCYLTLTNALCVGLSNGEIYTINETGTKCDLVGVCEDGIQAMEWSPDQELVVVVAKNHNMILMSCTFDSVNEMNLINDEFGEKQFITVGWGKKETQFHGSEGKQAAKTKIEVTNDPAMRINESVKITWRGDGHLYAIGFAMDSLRRFKVFDRDGNLQYSSEIQPGLEANLSWRPSGNVIATTQKLPNKYVVAFFEKNGLKHGDFTIPVNDTTIVEDLSWSSDSDILAVQCADRSNGKNSVLLFTISNYHWYLKQTLVFKETQKIQKMLWDIDFDVASNKRLHMFLRDGTILTYTWVWGVDHSAGNDDNDDAIVGVIDGNKLLVTGFRQTIVPPPMAALEITLEANVNSIHFLNNVTDGFFSSNDFVVYTEDSKLHFFKESNKHPLLYVSFMTINLESRIIPFQVYSWHWVNTKRIICVQNDNGTYNLLDFEIDFDVQKDIILMHSITLPDSIMGANVHPQDQSHVFLQLADGQILEYATNGVITPLDFKFSTVCPKFNVVSIENELYFLGLSYKNVFYINNRTILTSVSSFFVHTYFILLTTMQHNLLCTELTKPGLDSLMEYKKSECSQVYKRKIERGAKLVISVPNDTRTIFQMPRGNLEAIQPRPISLKIIGELINLLKYRECFDIMRKQRINLNLIIDHDPEKFMKNVEIFLNTINNNSWLNLFISDLENIDVTKTMYSSSYPEQKINAIYNIDSKIIYLCDVLIDTIETRTDRNSKILPLLTALVKKNTIEDLENALTIIKELKTKESNGPKLQVGSDEALKYLLYMVDVSQLFDIALGMYDFDLVLLVATKSQKDPKEYIPMLNEFNEMDENYKRFMVDKNLKRFNRAVNWLAKCGPERYGELRNFVKYHSLYRQSLKLFKSDEMIYKQISEDFGLYLKLKKQYTEAGIAYRKAGNIEKAVECFKDALEWVLAIDLAVIWPKEQFQGLCSGLVHELQQHKRHDEALFLLEKYCDNSKLDVINYATQCGHYKTALRLCSQDESNVKDTVILPKLMEDSSSVMDLIQTTSITFKRHKERLQVARANKIKNIEESYDVTFNNKDSDLYSDAGSTLASSASRSSSRTFRSSKNRRKHERKVASLKEGSQYEDVALVMELHKLVTSAFALRKQVKEMIVALCCLDLDDDALQIQTSLDKLLNEMKDSFKQIWTNELVLEATNASILALNVPDGCSAVPQGIAMLEPHIRIAPVIKEIEWKLDSLQ